MSVEERDLGDGDMMYRCTECDTDYFGRGKAEECCAPEDDEGDDDAPTAEVTPEDVANHYAQLKPLYEELGALEGGLYCPGNYDHYGWYKEDARAKSSKGGRARPWGLAAEYDALREELDRVLYATLNYVPRDFYADAWGDYTWQKRGDDWRRDFAGDTPLPNYGELEAYAIFADVDLEDEYKKARPSGDAPTAAVEDALQRYIDAFADLAGDRGAVHALDSVGGAYIMVAPTATAPLAEEFDKEARGLLFDELTDRVNNWLDDTADDVTAAVPEVEGVFEPDLINNKNRQYKAIMSVHKSLDGVVTPIDTDAPAYDYTPLHAVTDDDRDAAVEWARSFTDDYRPCVAALVGALWPEYSADADGWKDALRTWVREQKAERKARKRVSEKRREAAREKLEEYESSDAEYADYDTVTATVDALDVRDVAAHFSAEWDTAPGRAPPRFAPSWRQSSSGQSCFADREKFVDLAEGTSGGGAVKLAARSKGLITHCEQSVTGEDFRRAVAALRAAGFDVPLLERKGKPTLEEAGLDDDPKDAKEAAQKFLAMQQLQD